MMRPSVLAGIIALGVVLIAASFHGGRVSERLAQQESKVREKENASAIPARKHNRLISGETASNDHVLIANVATVSFGELWDVMRAAGSEKRTAWAHELEQMPPGPRQNAAVETFYKIWVELDPVAAAKGLEGIQNKRIQRHAFTALAGAAADSALPIVAELQCRIGYPESNFSSWSVVARWADADPERAARFLEVNHLTMPPGRFFDIAYSWATTDPEKAGEWLAKLEVPTWHSSKYPRRPYRQRCEAARGLLLGWIDKDSQGAAQYVAANANDPDLKETLGEFGVALYTRSTEQAAAFIRSLPNEDAQREALSEIIDRLGTKSISLTEGGDEEEPKEPEMDPEKIPPWLVTLPEKLWIDYAGRIFQAWDQTDAASAEAWLRGLPSDAKSNTIIDYCASVSAEQASRVFELVALVDNANARKDALQKFAHNFRDDPAKAREKIANLPLTDQQKQTLQSLLGKSQ
jgi:hypothetical protein